MVGPVVLSLCFAMTALAYASVGFGGGSTYTALLTFTDLDHRSLPLVSLACNVAVSALGVWAFWRAGHVRLADGAPFLVGSIPAAYGAGFVMVSPTVFFALLGGALALSGAQMLAQDLSVGKRAGSDVRRARAPGAIARGWPVSLGIGAGIGFFASLVGIGGGIFLSPILHGLRRAPAHQIAGVCAVFILVNSVAGLAGRLMAADGGAAAQGAAGYWLLTVVVIAAGGLGAGLGARVFAPVALRRITALLVLLAAGRLLWMAATSAFCA